MATYYLDAAATGSGNGTTWGDAWTSFFSVSGLSPGDVVYIATGSYAGGKEYFFSGTSDSPIILRRATVTEHGSDVGWSDGMDGTVTISGGNYGINFTCNWVTLDGASRYGIYFNGAAYASIGLGQGGAKNDYQANGITLRYVEIDGTGGGIDGVQGRGDDLTIEFCYVHDLKDNASATHPDGVQLFSGLRLVARYNLFENNGSMFILGETTFGTERAQNAQFYYNIFRNDSGVSGPYTCLHWSSGVSDPVQSGYYVYVYNNVFDLASASSDGFDKPFSISTHGGSFLFKNNIVVNSEIGPDFSRITHEYNCYYGNDGSTISETGGVNADPLFIGAENYQLDTGSPCMEAGTDVGLSVDYAGTAVTSTPDMGAYQSSALEDPDPPWYKYGDSGDL